ncbi:MAG TPA: hypothetical protein VJU84_08845 [Pyrinomonadaceae bacterium]|nr:hypothetical protein [Pyrinomonadaceae bacterium]
MQFPPTTFARILDSEFKRIYEQEDKTMEELVGEIAQLVNRRPREIYNWRCGKWPVPSSAIPTLCRRFGSTALVNALVAECSDVAVVVPEGADVPRMVTRTMKKDLALFEQFLDAHDSDGFQPHELRTLREMAEQTIADIYRLVEVAGADCDHRTQLRLNPSDHPGDHSKRSGNNSSDHLATHGGGRT